jgi:hypothetical protein
MRVDYFLGKTRQTDMDGPIMCSPLMLEREEHLKTKLMSVSDGTGKLKPHVFLNFFKLFIY